ncbi:MAG: 4Fe-4S dicluster domain-containing protein [Lachnospiraceae bacterium]|nr:4Fe-4S dicluster domain-containing protein [Lachnospiraceae bacterium]
MKKELGSFVIGDSTRCTGCKACEVACFAVHQKNQTNQKNQTAGSRSGRTVGTITAPVAPRLFLTRFEQGCMPVQCKHCEDAPCLNVCTKNALIRIDHQIVVDPEKCIGCKDCMQACHFGAVALLPEASDSKTPVLKTVAVKCDLCQGRAEGPACVQVCPHQALRLVNPEAEQEDKRVKAANALFLTRGKGGQDS